MSVGGLHAGATRALASLSTDYTCLCILNASVLLIWKIADVRNVALVPLDHCEGALMGSHFVAATPKDAAAGLTGCGKSTLCACTVNHRANVLIWALSVSDMPADAADVVAARAAGP
jgi:hypothetical protein